jgi:hypothetical protein
MGSFYFDLHMIWSCQAGWMNRWLGVPRIKGKPIKPPPRLRKHAQTSDGSSSSSRSRSRSSEGGANRNYEVEADETIRESTVMGLLNQQEEEAQDAKVKSFDEDEGGDDAGASDGGDEEAPQWFERWLGRVDDGVGSDSLSPAEDLVFHADSDGEEDTARDTSAAADPASGSVYCTPSQYFGAQGEGIGASTDAKLDAAAASAKAAAEASAAEANSAALTGATAEAAANAAEAAAFAFELRRREYVKQTLDRAIRTFNVNPKRGAAFVMSEASGMVAPGDAAGFAEFLITTKGLNKEKVGEYLGGDTPFHVATLAAFARLCDLGRRGFTGAIRAYLATFRLPGEAQKIDRILEAFSEAYFAAVGGGQQAEANAGEATPETHAGICSADSRVGGSGDNNSVGGVVAASAELRWMSSSATLHILAFSTIMLNTDAHNPGIFRLQVLGRRQALCIYIFINARVRCFPCTHINVMFHHCPFYFTAMLKRDKMTKAQFVKNNRGIDGGRDVPREVLEGLYDDIQGSPILTLYDREDEGNLFTHPTLEGCVTRR